MKRHVVGIREAKNELSGLLREAHAGTEVVIARHGRPVARLVAYRAAPAPQKPGMFAGQIKIKPGFDAVPDSFDSIA